MNYFDEKDIKCTRLARLFELDNYSIDINLPTCPVGALVLATKSPYNHRERVMILIPVHIKLINKTCGAWYKFNMTHY